MTNGRAKPRYLMWMDVETTGLDPKEHHILELAYELTEFEYPYERVGAIGRSRGGPHDGLPIYGPGSDRPYDSFLLADGYGKLMTYGDAFVKDMHERSGLRFELEKIADLRLREGVIRGSSVSASSRELEKTLLELSKDWPTNKDEKVMLAGCSVGFDLGFLKHHMPTFAKRLSHRSFDASDAWSFLRSVGIELEKNEESKHRAMDDLRDAQDLARRCARRMSPRASNADGLADSARSLQNDLVELTASVRLLSALSLTKQITAYCACGRPATYQQPQFMPNLVCDDCYAKLEPEDVKKNMVELSSAPTVRRLVYPALR